MVKRSAFTLIELLFAIVVISITVLSLPMMTQVSATSTNANLVQEAIFAASTELNGIVAAHWDENSMLDDPNSLARVIDIDDINCTQNRLQGHIKQPLHRRCLNDSTIDPKDLADDDEIYALEDLQHSNTTLFAADIQSAQGYKKSYYSSVDINRSTTFGDDKENTKEIKLTVTDADGNTITILKTYSANIGEVDYFKRVY